MPSEVLNLVCVMGNRHSWPPARRRRLKKFLLVAIDDFSKWVEAEAYANIKDKDVSKLFGKTSSVSSESYKQL